MRLSKCSQGSFIVLYDEKMRAQALLAQQLESRLDQALQENEFVVYYHFFKQPQVNFFNHTVFLKDRDKYAWHQKTFVRMVRPSSKT